MIVARTSLDLATSEIDCFRPTPFLMHLHLNLSLFSDFRKLLGNKLYLSLSRSDLNKQPLTSVKGISCSDLHLARSPRTDLCMLTTKQILKVLKSRHVFRAFFLEIFILKASKQVLLYVNINSKLSLEMQIYNKDLFKVNI